MGKVRRLRHKLHIATQKDQQESLPTTSEFNPRNLPDLVLPVPSDNLFAELNIDVDNLKSKLNDDVQSVKSFKSLKSEKSGKNILPKKEKLKLRKEMLLRKIDAVNQMKKDLKVREKRKTNAIIGDTNPLHDALPSLESLLKSRPNIKQNMADIKKKKPIEKAKKRRKEVVQGVKIFKTVLNNNEFKKNPLEAITQHVQALVSQEKQKIRK